MSSGPREHWKYPKVHPNGGFSRKPQETVVHSIIEPSAIQHNPAKIWSQDLTQKYENQPQQRCDFPSLGNITSIQNRRYLLMLSVSSSTWSFRHPFRGQHETRNGGLSTPQLGVNFSDAWALRDEKQIKVSGSARWIFPLYRLFLNVDWSEVSIRKIKRLIEGWI